ncbi:TPA: glycosyltransferase [Candidatus Bathyarchaeota archaeon]|nr:glycosyltransferase [Candidatus Bathyarchaeota archaeon]
MVYLKMLRESGAYLIVTIPVYNEVNLVEDAVKTVERAAAKITDDYKVVIAEDGSTDGTLKKIIELSESNPHVTYLHSIERLGRGRSLKRAWKRIDGQIYVYLDSDLATDMTFFPQLVKWIENGYDLVTGSRYMPGSIVERPILREIISRIYNLILRFLFRTGVKDHQCGFKAFSRRLIRQVLPKCNSTHWFWDSEIIILAKREGYNILEIPVRWKERRRRKTSIKRLLNDILIHGSGIIYLLYRIG